MRSRLLPGSTLRFSEVGASLGHGGKPHTGWVESQGSIRLLQRLRSLGITFFDISGAADAAAWRHCLRQAFPIEDPELTLAVGVAEIDRFVGEDHARRGKDREAPRCSESALERILADAAAQLGKVKIGIVMVSVPEDWSPHLETLARTLADLISQRTIRAWGIECTARAAEGDALRTAIERGAQVVAVPLSLLNDQTYLRIVSRISIEKAGLLARDPHAGGRLDGSWFAETPRGGRPGQHPRRVSEFESEFEGVLSLGFLTADHQRTLAQAAVQFCLARPGVLSVVLDSPSVGLAESLSRLEELPPIPPSDLERVGRTVPR